MRPRFRLEEREPGSLISNPSLAESGVWLLVS
jgi:hypothetical protein